MGDGIRVNLPPHPRIFTTTVPKVGHGRAAGAVRNGGIQLTLQDDSPIPTPEYIGFLDDDDVLTPNYVELLTGYTANQDDKPDIVMFRMNEHIGGILPPPGQNVVAPNKVGISFAAKTQIFQEGHLFEPSSMEDYFFLKKMEGFGKTIFFAPETTYLVRPQTKTRRVFF